MLRIAEHFQDSHVGRQRQGNEDRFFARSPLFVVADGMGGAQAGEVASEMAVRTFDRGLQGDGDPTARLVRAIEDANGRIHERSRSDRERAGMGTTITAAYVGEEAVHVAHVGDSRAYLLRDHEMARLTRDHSLVGELIARGKLTEEQAEAHPQRSVITRALGPEPQVEVDVDVFPARDGDTFLLCSDGLTSMVPERRVAGILDSAESLAAAGRALIDAANAAGGRDNITVVLFRLEEVGGVGGPASAHAERAQADTAEGRTLEYDTLAGGEALTEPPARERDRERGSVAVAPRAERTLEHAAPERDRGRRGRRRERRRILPGTGWMLLTVGLILPLIVAAWLATRSVYFVGTNAPAGRTITIFRGLPYELPFGIKLYERYAGSGVTIDGVPVRRREVFLDHKLRSRDGAANLVKALERGRIE